MNKFDYSVVTNPRFFRDNVLAPHCDAEYFAPNETLEISSHLTGEYLREDDVTPSTAFREKLNGTWKILVANNYDSLITGWEASDFNCHCWEDIYVPAHIQMEGHGIPHYTNVAYPWDGHEEIHQGQIPTEFNPVAAYVKYFYIPERFLGERLFISFKGVESSMALFLNGRYVGYAEDSFTPSDFELTDYIVEGENKLGLLVTKWSSGSWLEDQDFFRFSGIFRDVILYTKPEVHAEDICVKTILSDDFTSAKLNISLLSSAQGNVSLKLIDFGAPSRRPLPFNIDCSDRTPIEELPEKIVFEQDKKLKKGINNYVINVRKPSLWSAEKPYLYGLAITLSTTDNICTEVIPMQIGFRRFEIVDGLMMINGKRIVFNGVNRHEFSSVSGRAISYPETRHDFINIKRNNINALRTCHYPDNSYVYALADNLGLYVIDETNMETHGTWSYQDMTPEEYCNVVPGDNPDWEAAVLDRVNNIYNRDKNHASVLIWSCGNESHGGINIFKMHNKFRELDETRPVHYEGVCHDRRYNDSSDMESQMYPKVWDIEKFLAEHPDKPYICCEYTHAMGNSCGGMHKYVELTEREPRYQGGFIWDYIDQSITVSDRYGQSFEAYGGDFGDRPTEYNFSGNGIAYGGPDRESSPKMPEVKYNYQLIKVLFNADYTFEVVNKSLFTRTSDYNCSVTLLCNGVPAMSAPVATDTAPLSTSTYSVPEAIVNRISALSSSENASSTTLVEFAILVKFAFKFSSMFANAGDELAYGQYIFTPADTSTNAPKKSTRADKVLRPYVISKKANCGVKGEDFEIQFSDRGLTSYKKCGRELIEGVPSPAFWRAPIDNDNGNGMQFRYAEWKIADLYSKASNHKYSVENDHLIAEYTYAFPNGSDLHATLRYFVEFDGRIDVTLHMDPIGEHIEMPVFGMNFKFNADFDNMRWYGYGPGETYVDRSHGNPIGIHTSKVSKQMSKYLVPQECANKIGVRNAAVTDAKGRGILFTAMSDEAICKQASENTNLPLESLHRYVDEKMSKELANSFEFQALNYSAAEIESATHHTELPKAHFTNVRIALAQLGVGGDDSWGARTHEEYRIDASKGLDFGFSFIAT